MLRALRGWAGAALIVAGPALAADPSSVLVAASRAVREASYQGVVVYRDARTMEVLRLVHRQKDGQAQERLTSLTGQPRDVVSVGEGVSCIVTGGPALSAAAMPQSLVPALSPAILERASQHYELRDSGESRVAGRSCRAVALSPRDDFRYGYDVCADTITGVPLRVSVLDRGGQPVEQMTFTEVSFPGAIDDSAFELPPGAARPAEVQAMNAAAPVAWQLDRLPPGFEVIARRRMPGDGPAVDHVILSDGLSAVSVFGGRLAPAAQPFSGVSRVGAMNAYGRAVGAFHVTVVGEVPESTVRLVGDGFRPQPATQAAAAAP